MAASVSGRAGGVWQTLPLANRAAYRGTCGQKRRHPCPEDIADGVAYMVTRPRHASIGELWIMPTDQA
ncbi:hypothetical protein [Arthrobacter sp. 4R501]|uniref:hypothetical protein n=1 Tax=Arthrobacter sp. 4R501 TaxID=2058886 RepID=UPI001CA51CF3|nr:hypothetical protein [Arthrobacter sp. 4R501]